MATALASPASGATTATPAAQQQARLERLRSRTRRPGEASFFYWDAHFGKEAVKVLPGEFFVHDEDVLVMTTLGSCIAACLWDRERRVGGMNHFLLPDAGEGGVGDASGRYGSFAMDQLIGELVKRGANRSTMEAKVFGGGAVISGMTSLNVGERNTKFVLEYLRTERITVVSKDVQDVYPRKVCYLPASGKAMVKRLASANTDALLAQERSAAQRLGGGSTAAAGGTIDLF
ncbi:MAG: chemoreceptor glutamine deamidase CheD [Betaproteobacteria bacterium]|nr:chemoreceptor glutamine deamidase CheD [Betaproteobacteria bacterium]MCC6850916.1 chemoreceptor glutamine deamidase CheD [Rubrivivax sp.]MCL4699117.1 chemoreceptor glutamine deamidase CheD [Burkholderiaceae bacterium]